MRCDGLTGDSQVWGCKWGGGGGRPAGPSHNLLMDLLVKLCLVHSKMKYSATLIRFWLQILYISVNKSFSEQNYGQEQRRAIKPVTDKFSALRCDPFI